MKYLSVIVFLFFCNSVNAQSYMQVKGGLAYWNHTEVFGGEVGLGYSYHLKNINLYLNYSFGYGTRDKLSKKDNINYDYWTTVFIKGQSDTWDRYLGFSGNDINDLTASSDYGKQHQITAQIGYPIYKFDKFEIELKAGGYLAMIEHFFTADNLIISDIYLPLTYSGPLNYIPVTTQRIFTYGLSTEVSVNIINKGFVYSPFIGLGVGPNHGSYLNGGIMISYKLLELNSN